MAHLVLYDGVCGLCNRLNRFLWERDRRDAFRFTTLQGQLANRVLVAHGRSPAELSTFYAVADFGTPAERVLDRSRAALFVIGELGGAWRAARLLAIVPRPLADAAYDLLARYRYRLFGRHDRCPVPPAHVRDKFLETA